MNPPPSAEELSSTEVLSLTVTLKLEDELISESSMLTSVVVLKEDVALVSETFMNPPASSVVFTL